VTTYLMALQPHSNAFFLFLLIVLLRTRRVSLPWPTNPTNLALIFYSLALITRSPERRHPPLVDQFRGNVTVIKFNQKVSKRVYFLSLVLRTSSGRAWKILLARMDSTLSLLNVSTLAGRGLGSPVLKRRIMWTMAGPWVRNAPKKAKEGINLWRKPPNMRKSGGNSVMNGEICWGRNGSEWNWKYRRRPLSGHLKHLLTSTLHLRLRQQRIR
jgi:hypothetical protein